MIAIKMQSGGEQCECNHLTMTLSLRKTAARSTAIIVTCETQSVFGVVQP